MKVRSKINILAIDQARNGAWSIFNYEEKKLMAYGSFAYGTEYTYTQMSLALEGLMGSIIEAYDVAAVFLEDIQMRQNIAAFKKLAMLLGVLAAYCERREYLYDFIAPSSWQNYCKARSRTDKEKKDKIIDLSGGKKQSKILSLGYVKDQFGITTENDNLSDAICMGWYVVNERKIQYKEQQ